LLAGTPTANAIGGCPVRLYTIDSTQKLRLVREVVSGDCTGGHPSQPGLWDIRDDMDDKIYVVYPHTTPTTVSIIHKERPATNDVVVFNPQSYVVANSEFGVAAGDGHESYLLSLLLEDLPTGFHDALVSVAGDKPEKKPRLGENDWSLYKSFRYHGAPGGPIAAAFCTLGFIKDNHVRIQVSQGVGPDLDDIPPFPLEGCSGALYIVVATARYFAFAPPPPVQDLYVHDRKLNSWRDLKSASTVPYARSIFGSWLATIVEIWGSRGEEPNPGAENERDRASPLLPNVRAIYPVFAAQSRTYIPGTLLLDNLEDGRRITLNTGQEDSEILTVRDDGLVLYRVNDSIFAAQIEGDKLGKPSLVVKDEDVPEVHWVFWSHSPR
jgi:hypothetical protein